MPVLPNNTDPSKDYVTSNSYGSTPPLTVDGLVFNQVYAYTGVIDTLNNSITTGYSDPSISIANNSNGLLTFEPNIQEYWLSNQDFGGPTSKPVVLTYNLSSDTYYNNISLYVLNVPCFVELLDNNGNALPGTSTYTINGGSDIYTTVDWLLLNYNAPSTNKITGDIQVRITRNKNVQVSNAETGISNVSYSVGVKNFRIKLNVQKQSDIPLSVISGSNSITTQNRFGIIENYNYNTNSISNMFVNNSNYWKSAPQPVRDSVVYFYVEVSADGVTPALINRLYIDPLYSSCRFNVYWTTNSGNADPSTFTWTPINRDFTLRKGIYEIPMTSCTYLKFEFTQLALEVYDLPFDSIDRIINVFPYQIENYYSALEQNIMNGNSVNYSYVGNSNLATQSSATDQLSPSTVYGISKNTMNDNAWPSLTNLNTSQYGNSTTIGVSTSSQIIDPSISYKLIDTNGNYNQNSYNEFLQRRFPQTQVHNYTQVSIEHSWHEAYFVGIRYLTTFYEQMYDDLRAMPGNWTAKNNTTNGFAGQNTNYVYLNPDDTATSPWFSTIDKFNGFSIGGLTSDWRSFLTQGNQISSDLTLLNNANPFISQMTNKLNSSMTLSGALGESSIYNISCINSGSLYGVQSASYQVGNNLVNYYDANFIVPSGYTEPWYALSGGISATTVTWSETVSGVTNTGTASGISVTGTSPVAAYNFTLPNVYSTTGGKPWTTQLGTPAMGVVGYASYSPVSGMSYNFLVNLQAAGTTNVKLYTQFINPTTSGVIPGTTVTGTIASLAAASGSAVITATGTNYTGGLPSNTIQLVLSGSNSTPFSIYQLGIFNQPTTQWISPTDRSNMRISGVARMFLPRTNLGSYRVSLFGVTSNNAQVELAYKTFAANSLPLNTWFDVELTSFTSINYSSFFVKVVQTNTSITESFNISMLAPFYNPIRYEYITRSGDTNWQPIITGINNPDAVISTISGLPASGIQVRLTALDPNVFVAGVSIVPKYNQNPYYANLDIDYLGSSKTNEISSRMSINNKPYFQLNQEYHPAMFNINRIAQNVNFYSLD